MAWVATDACSDEYIFQNEPKRDGNWWVDPIYESLDGQGRISAYHHNSDIRLPKGSIKKLIGRDLDWGSNPVNLDTFDWKDIENWESYSVSTLGDILRKDKSKILILSLDKDGYLQVRLSHNNKQKTFKIHRLVAQAFIPNPNNLSQVNHKNGIKSDNRVENLEWCDGKYNVNYSHSKIYHDSIIHRMKPVIQLSLDGKVIQKFESIRSASRSIGTTSSHISDACNGKYKQCKGYIWKWYKEDNPVELKEEQQ